MTDEQQPRAVRRAAGQAGAQAALRPAASTVNPASASTVAQCLRTRAAMPASSPLPLSIAASRGRRRDHLLGLGAQALDERRGIYHRALR